MTKEALALIEEMRLKHEAEIHSLSEQLKLEPEFIKVRYCIFYYIKILTLFTIIFIFKRIYLFLKYLKEYHEISERTCTTKKKKNLCI